MPKRRLRLIYAVRSLITTLIGPLLIVPVSAQQLGRVEGVLVHPHCARVVKGRLVNRSPKAFLPLDE